MQLWELTVSRFDTLAVFHFEMSSLKVSLLAKTHAMLVTMAVFQPTMLPYVAAAAVGLVAQAVTAPPIFELVMAMSACVPGAASSNTASHSDPTPQMPRCRRRGSHLAAPNRNPTAASKKPASVGAVLMGFILVMSIDGTVSGGAMCAAVGSAVSTGMAAKIMYAEPQDPSWCTTSSEARERANLSSDGESLTKIWAVQSAWEVVLPLLAGRLPGGIAIVPVKAGAFGADGMSVATLVAMITKLDVEARVWSSVVPCDAGRKPAKRNVHTPPSSMHRNVLM
jgi:hypothetical protein